MAEIRESQRRLQEDLAEAKGKLADIHADTQAKLAEAKKNIKAVKEKEWHQEHTSSCEELAFMFVADSYRGSTRHICL